MNESRFLSLEQLMSFPEKDYCCGTHLLYKSGETYDKKLYKKHT